MVSLEIIGLIGAALTVIAYLPQAIHIKKEHCSGGISRGSWLIWLLATILLLIYAVTTNNRIFILLEIVNVIAIIIILMLIKVYGKRVCHSIEPLIKKRK